MHPHWYRCVWVHPVGVAAARERAACRVGQTWVEARIGGALGEGRVGVAWRTSAEVEEWGPTDHWNGPRFHASDESVQRVLGHLRELRPVLEEES